jgi:4-hydroxybenzoate polyprenyltransferase
LGICLGGAALGGWIAANGSLETVAPWLLALAVTTWVAGFDIIYALHDIEFDRKEKLFSIPGRFGAANSLNISSLLHLATVIFLSLLGIELGLGLIYMAGVVIIAAMLIYEHYLVKADDFSKINAAFFTTNGIVSIIAFFMIVLDHIWQF